MSKIWQIDKNKGRLQHRDVLSVKIHLILYEFKVQIDFTKHLFRIPKIIARIKFASWINIVKSYDEFCNFLFSK